MKYFEIKKEVVKIIQKIESMNIDLKFSDDVLNEKYILKEKWFLDLPDSQIPLADENGVYLYTTLYGEILYIGKGEYKNKGGIGARAISHLGAAGSRTNILPYNKWNEDENIDKKTRSLITKGKFIIYSIAVKPDYFCSLVEVLLQTIIMDKDKKIPVLNKKIG